jgi:hypothetical protein
MHILMLVVIGLVVLAAFFFGAGLFNRSRQTGASVFIWTWLAASLVNAAAGVVHAGIPVVNEAAALIPIFGIPAAAGWYLAYKYRERAP